MDGYIESRVQLVRQIDEKLAIRIFENNPYRNGLELLNDHVPTSSLRAEGEFDGMRMIAHMFSVVRDVKIGDIDG